MPKKATHWQQELEDLQKQHGATVEEVDLALKAISEGKQQQLADSNKRKQDETASIMSSIELTRSSRELLFENLRDVCSDLIRKGKRMLADPRIQTYPSQVEKIKTEIRQLEITKAAADDELSI